MNLYNYFVSIINYFSLLQKNNKKRGSIRFKEKIFISHFKITKKINLN